MIRIIDHMSLVNPNHCLIDGEKKTINKIIKQITNYINENKKIKNI